MHTLMQHCYSVAHDGSGNVVETWSDVHSTQTLACCYFVVWSVLYVLIDDFGLIVNLVRHS